MKITMYELLGMVKDGKAPKKIKYDGFIWKFEKDNLYYSDNVWLDDYCNISQILNEKVEILGDEEKGLPEKLIPTSLKGIDNLDEKIEIAHIDTISVIDTVNLIIDYLEKQRKGE